MKKKVLVALCILFPIAALSIMLLMGREAMCTCGYIKLWHGVVVSSENSQHLFDWYTFTHIVHGLGFYLLLSIVEKLTKRKVSFLSKLLTAIFLESAWEVLENTNYVINKYRETTISLDYFGDSIVNSTGDILAMIAGFYAAYKKPIWFCIGFFLVLELGLLYFIKDNLIINIIMLIHPIDAIKLWQSGS